MRYTTKPHREDTADAADDPGDHEGFEAAVGEDRLGCSGEPAEKILEQGHRQFAPGEGELDDQGQGALKLSCLPEWNKSELFRKL